jgi:hypothetical protein
MVQLVVEVLDYNIAKKEPQNSFFFVKINLKLTL